MGHSLCVRPNTGFRPHREILNDPKALKTQNDNKSTDEILSTGYLVGHVFGGKEPHK